ncbi:MAG: hypothetical protein VX438_10535, partial [Planctomycetota bacterium]|nr:hypothetical protein [Planctomycetota bacterium]
LYSYRGIENPVLDLFYVCQVASLDHLELQPGEVTSCHFAQPEESIYRQMAFDSNRKAVKRFAETNHNP